MVCVTEITDYCQTYLEALVQWKQDGCTSKKREENHNTILHIVLREIMQPIDMDCVLANHCFKRRFIFSHHSLFTFLYILPVKYVIFYFLNLHITIACNLTQRKSAQYQNNHANFTVQNTHTHTQTSDVIWWNFALLASPNQNCSTTLPLQDFKTGFTTALCEHSQVPQRTVWMTSQLCKRPFLKNMECVCVCLWGEMNVDVRMFGFFPGQSFNCRVTWFCVLVCKPHNGILVKKHFMTAKCLNA